VYFSSVVTEINRVFTNNPEEVPSQGMFGRKKIAGLAGSEYAITPEERENIGFHRQALYIPKRTPKA